VLLVCHCSLGDFNLHIGCFYFFYSIKVLNLKDKLRLDILNHLNSLSGQYGVLLFLYSVLLTKVIFKQNYFYFFLTSCARAAYKFFCIFCFVV
jgi:hypothetical protein